MEEYAISELYSLSRKITFPILKWEPILEYACALVSELAYYLVSELEIKDPNKRAILVPCDAFQGIIATGKPTTSKELSETFDFQEPIWIEEDGVNAVLFGVGKILFVGFRGTISGFDMWIDIQAQLTQAINHAGIEGQNAMGWKFHNGFMGESVRMAEKLNKHIHKWVCEDKRYEYVLFTGHSLGGAVAAISAMYVCRLPDAVCMFASPRFCNGYTYQDLISKIPIVQVQRWADPIPTSPPKILGYVDHINAYSPEGLAIENRINDSSFFQGVRKWLGVKETHKMEYYRQDLGRTACQITYPNRLINAMLLTKSDVS